MWLEAVRVQRGRLFAQLERHPCRSSGLREGEIHSEYIRLYQTHTVWKQITRETELHLNMLLFNSSRNCGKTLQITLPI